MSISEDCVFCEIPMFYQKISDDDISKLLYNIYNTIIFSTIPYICHKETSSKSAMLKYNSGNCIALVEAVKYYLKKNLGINGYIIPANVPKRNKIIGTPTLSHCAILIPKSSTEFYIFDPALYFMEFMYCDLENNVKRQIKTSDSYRHSFYKIEYIIKSCNNLLLDEKYNQKLLDNCLFVECSSNNSGLLENWNYYLNEIKNPDNNIGESFLLNKPHPFLLYTIFENDQSKIKYKLVSENGIITIKKYPENETVFNGSAVQFETLPIKQELNKYLGDIFMLT
jgi:hypothetical protein